MDMVAVDMARRSWRTTSILYALFSGMCYLEYTRCNSHNTQAIASFSTSVHPLPLLFAHPRQELCALAPAPRALP